MRRLWSVEELVEHWSLGDGDDHRGVGMEQDFAVGLAPDEAGRQAAAQFAARRLVADDDVVLVPEDEAVLACHEAVRRWGYFGGASTGSVLAGLTRYLPRISRPARIALISPDMGGPYLQTVHSTAWVTENISPGLPTRPQPSAPLLPSDASELAAYCF